jgi:hypothetical protein
MTECVPASRVRRLGTIGRFNAHMGLRASRVSIRRGGTSAPKHLARAYQQGNSTNNPHSLAKKRHLHDGKPRLRRRFARDLATAPAIYPKLVAILDAVLARWRLTYRAPADARYAIAGKLAAFPIRT